MPHAAPASLPRARHDLLRLALAWWLALLALCAMPAGAQALAAQVQVPPLHAHVTDLAGMLQPGQRSTLEHVLAEYEARSGSQIAILLISKTEPEGIEDYAIRVADAWKVGRKGIDDGVILIVAKDNPKALRRMMIATGRGVQGSLTDAQSKRVLQDVIAPYFVKSDYYGGLTAGVSAIMPLLAQEHFAAPTRNPERQHAPTPGWFIALVSAFLLLFGFAGWAAIVSRRRSARAKVRGGSTKARGGRGNGSSLDNNTRDTTNGFVLGSLSSSGGGDSGSSGGGGGLSGDGGSFDGGGASGDW
ncbi:TPM domain-containing protein [Paraherbaspirillum soli]|uniref:TPM domain-containing protein n=1 Tax=Paraherbaspirillum soli TaxID=631222 RepID=A0ABW0M518_9BURK